MIVYCDKKDCIYNDIKKDKVGHKCKNNRILITNMCINGNTCRCLMYQRKENKN